MAQMHVRMKLDPGLVMYLVVVDKMLAKYRDIMLVRPTEKFKDMVYAEVLSHVIDQKEPPKAIRSAILNLADDMQAGHDVTLRAGDYIDLMTYAKEQKLL